MITFTNDGTCVSKMECSEEEISAVLAKSEQKQKRLRRLDKVMETAAAYRLKEIKNFQAREQLATWRRVHGYDRNAANNNQWASRPLPLTSKQFTESLWSELNALRDTVSMPEGEEFS